MADRLFELDPEEMWTPFHEEANQLLFEEKAARHENDAIKLADICKRIIQLSFDSQEYKRLNSFVLMLIKRRGQAKKAIIEMVDLAMTMIDKMPERISRMALITTVREATEGKFFVEVAYARATRFFAEMKVEDGEQEEASLAILEV
jgi:hypothetical protein